MERKELTQKALNILARREHCTAELITKLARYTDDEKLVESVVLSLKQENLLSDERFVEDYVRHRSKKGYGPLRIQQELDVKLLPAALIQQALTTISNWEYMAARVQQKKFGGMPVSDVEQKEKQMRFLQYRGFTNEQIETLFA